MILTNHINDKKNLPTSSRSSLYKETIALRQLANQEHPQQAEEEESDLGLDLGSYAKIILTLSGIALLGGFIAAALTQ